MSYISAVFSTMISGNAGETTVKADDGTETTTTSPSEHKHILGAMGVSAVVGTGLGVYLKNKDMIPDFLDLGAA